ncbi:hypothetical protein Corgl_1261 [Coriobacterium glomerans PW2]|uniref:DUF559 domain-containing protein n=1 Tax=Coriobacterium glomerans (strain ATCC 49209 / DSM 20642 / JCM 10262 / PW2) TaxID=700015 RepID=F2N8H9_CORGP|nr:hypothetical protein [Coriobacterium glomerans]AEB07362.1 hypothetical protein Corgl_1261 [Coriobacterium glomerans PW2]
MKAIDMRINELLREAHRAKRCLAIRSGNERRALRRRVRSHEVVEAEPGVFAEISYWKTLGEDERAMHRIRAQASLHPSWVFCMFSAAVVFGLEVPFELLGATHVASHGSYRTRSPGLLVRHRLSVEELERVDGIRVTGIDETVLKCLCATSTELGLAIVDSALHAGLTTKACLERYLKDRGSGRRGIDQARNTLQLADGRSENGGESRARAVMIEIGFPPIDLQTEFADPLRADRKFRVDYLWRSVDGALVAGELDGRAKRWDPALLGGRTSAEAMEQERQREALLTAHGLRIVRFSFRQAQDRAGLARLLAAYGILRNPVGGLAHCDTARDGRAATQ